MAKQLQRLAFGRLLGLLGNQSLFLEPRMHTNIHECFPDFYLCSFVFIRGFFMTPGLGWVLGP